MWKEDISCNKWRKFDKLHPHAPNPNLNNENVYILKSQTLPIPGAKSNLIIKCNFGGLFVGVDILEECTVGIVLLLLNSCAEFKKILGNILVCGLENVDQSSFVSMLQRGKKGGSKLTRQRDVCLVQ